MNCQPDDIPEEVHDHYEREAEMRFEEKTVFVVWRNTDLTEGRGWQVPHAVCWKQSTAIRQAKGVDVQGSNGQVKEAKAFKIDGLWYAPAQIIHPTTEDDRNEERLKRREKIREKMLNAGISEAEITELEQDLKDADQA